MLQKIKTINRRYWIIGSVVLLLLLVIGILATLKLNKSTQTKDEDNLANTLSYPISYTNESVSYPISFAEQSTNTSTEIPQYTFEDDNLLQVPPISYSKYDGTYSIVSSKYILQVYQNWYAQQIESEHLLKLMNENKLLMTVKDIESELSSKDWYQLNYPENTGTEDTTSINKFDTYKIEYSNNSGNYTDYAIKFDNTIIFFHYIKTEGEVDNTNYQQYIELVVNSIRKVTQSLYEIGE